MFNQHNTKTRIQTQFEVPLEQRGNRIDQVLVKLLPDYSRERLKEWLISGNITVDAVCWRPKNKVAGGEKISIDIELKSNIAWLPEEFDLNIVHEDEHVIVVDKPPGLVVHPGNGNPSGTLVNALLARYPELAIIPRAGIVHRLDKDTSGLLVVARSLKAQTSLIDQLKARSMRRQYLALVFGRPRSEGIVDAAIDRHRFQRTKMAVSSKGKEAVTHYRVLESSQLCSWVKVKLNSGRTHQIRVHMTHIGHPLVGDPVYQQGRPCLQKVSVGVRDVLDKFPRQALHAKELGLIHPHSGASLQWEVGLPSDLLELKGTLDFYDI